MAKGRRQKHMRLPNGYGSIRYLGKNRRNCYAVHPPADLSGNRPPAICYVDDWYKGFAVLTAYRAGTYQPGMENALDLNNTSDLADISKRVLADYSRQASTMIGPEKTFAEVYDSFYAWKYNGRKSLSESSKRLTRFAFQQCSTLHDKTYSTITYSQMQAVIDGCNMKHASLETILSLFKQMAKFAMAESIITDLRNVQLLTINIEDDDEHGVPFSDEDLEIIWKHKENSTAEFILIMCYSGFRISAYKTLKVDLENLYFQGGVKTKASKNRIVPIHSSIQPIVRNRIERDGCLFSVEINRFRKDMQNFLESIKIERHTPHDCRHTFSRLCEKYDVREADRKRLLGHSFGSDITNNVYGHRTLDDLRVEIEKIKV